MTTMAARRAVAIILVCFACAVAAGVTFYAHLFPFRPALMTVQAATFGVLGGFWLYLRPARSRP